MLVGNHNQVAADLYLFIYNLLLKYRINTPLEIKYIFNLDIYFTFLP